MSASLLIDGAGLWAYHYQLDKAKKTTFGRSSSNDIKLPDPKVSSRHGAFFHQNGQWRLEDFGSSNGTMVNGSRITNIGLRNEDTIRLGDTDIVFRDKESAVSDDVWGKTVLKVTKHETAIRGAVQRAGAHEVVVVPDLHLSPPTISSPIDSQFDREEFASGRFAPIPESKAKQPDMEREDLIWVAEKLADVLGVVARMSTHNRLELFKRVLEELQTHIDADNGFLMIPNPQTRKWVIEAWVGDPLEWTDYEKQHPVPLTLANKAFEEDSLVTNAFGPDRAVVSGSLSMMKLNVQFYIALPLHRNGRKEGLLYFDIRKGLQPFKPRDAMLVERVGNYLLEFDRELSRPG